MKSIKTAIWQSKTRCVVVAAVVSTTVVTSVNAQGPGGAISGAQSAVQRRAQQQVQTEVQTRVQQRVQAQVQAQVQNQVQAQVQARVQSQVAGGIEARINNQLDRTARQAAGLAARVEAQKNSARSSAPNARIGANFQAEANSDLRVGNDQSRASTSNRSGARVNTSADPIQITTGDVADYDSIFGQFNPLRTATMVRANSPGAIKSETKIAENFAAGLGRGPVNRQSTASQSSNGMIGDGRPEGSLAVAGVLAGNVDLSSMIEVAARQRRAEISQIRDQAIASANAEMMAQADAMETQLNAFATARQETMATASQNASASANAAGNTSGSATVR